VTAFLIAAALMVVGASALVLIPLLRRANAEQRRATTSALVVVLALPLFSGWPYTRWRTSDMLSSDEAASTSHIRRAIAVALCVRVIRSM